MMEGVTFDFGLSKEMPISLAEEIQKGIETGAGEYGFLQPEKEKSSSKRHLSLKSSFEPRSFINNGKKGKYYVLDVCIEHENVKSKINDLIERVKPYIILSEIRVNLIGLWWNKAGTSTITKNGCTEINMEC